MFENLITIRDIASGWILSLNDIGNYFFNSAVADFLDDLIKMFDLTLLQPLNLLLIPLSNILDFANIGQMSLFEFTLGGAVGFIVFATLLGWFSKWIPFM